ncbi:MAG: hypothetical protein J6Y02_16405 [Pseudobutyrivibrio sp.]|nr:hypothetical protein [Pseudobutyrivibrio sp.]
MYTEYDYNDSMYHSALSHSAKGSTWKGTTKYIDKVWKNGKWIYVYKEGKKNPSDAKLGRPLTKANIVAIEAKDLPRLLKEDNDRIQNHRKNLEEDARVNRYSTKDAKRELDYLNDKISKKHNNSKTVPALYLTDDNSRWTSKDVKEAYELHGIKRKKRK